MILHSDLSTAFAGCSKRFAEIHLDRPACLDGSPHDGSPCFLNDESRSAEALHLLTFVPPAAYGPGVTLGPDGTPGVS
jgi:hypothetical protein